MALGIKVAEFDHIDHGRMAPKLYAHKLFHSSNVERYEWLQDNMKHDWEIQVDINVHGMNYLVYIVFHDDVDAVHYRMRWS